MHLIRALHHLAGAGVTPDVLRAGGVDPTDRTAVRHEVETLLRSAVAENSLLTDMRGIAALQLAFAALLTPAERRAGDALAQVLRTDLVAAGVVLPGPDLFEACLTTLEDE